jgi:AcrR family transcriptional regulator
VETIQRRSKARLVIESVTAAVRSIAGDDVLPGRGPWIHVYTVPKGPSAIKARAVTSAIGLSTTTVYHHFGGVAELVSAVADHGFAELGEAFSGVPASADPVADLFAMALACRRIARANPHLYDLMFGLSTRATYRPPTEPGSRRSGRSPAFRAAYRHVTHACARLVRSDRAGPQDPEVVAAQLWCFVHGYITLELGGHFDDLDDPVAEVLVPMAVNFAVALGDDPARAEASHQAVLRSR